jgi:putative oxidoreductase
MTYLFLLGRILFGGFFALNGLSHLTNLEKMTGYAASKNVPSPKVAVFLTGVLLLLSGLSIVAGIYPTLGIWGIIIFLIPTTFMMHNYWAAKDPNEKMGAEIQFKKNLALLGAALVFLMLSTPWPLSLM